MTIDEQIEEIIMEASAYGLSFEVIETAKQYQSEGIDKLLSFENAFNEWIK